MKTGPEKRIVKSQEITQKREKGLNLNNNPIIEYQRNTLHGIYHQMKHVEKITKVLLADRQLLRHSTKFRTLAYTACET